MKREMKTDRFADADGGRAPEVLTLWGLVVLLVLMLVLVGSTTGTARAQPPGEEAEVVRVEAIEITGNEHVEARTILKGLPFAEGDEITVPDDLLRAENALMQLGFFQRVVVDYRRGEEGIVVLLDVLENPLIEEIDVRGNRDWNEDRRLVIPWVNWSLRWPFTNYLVSPDRIEEIFQEHDVEPGRVLNLKKLQDALGIKQPGLCPANAPKNSLCGEYISKGYFLVGISEVQPGTTVRVRLVEYVFEDVEVRGVAGPFREKALELLEALPRFQPLKLQQFQRILQGLSQSIYFEPLRQEDLTFAPGSAPDRVILVLSLRPRVILEEPVAVQKISFRGNTVFSETTLLKRVKLPQDGSEIDNFRLLQALENVYRMYRKEGYIFVKFAQGALQGDTLVLRVDEGRIGEVEIRQNGYTTARLTRGGFQELPLEREPVEAEAPPESGEPSRAPRAEEEAQAKGEPPSENPLLELLGRLADALGEFLGTANVGNLPRTDPRIIVKELAVRPGDLVNQFRLADTYRQLLDLGYFKDVGFDFEPLDSGEYKLVLDVTEQDKLGSFNGGFSFSAEGIVGNLSLSGKNLYGTGQDISLQLDRGIVGKAVTNWSVDYQTRTLLDFAEYLQIKLFNNTSQEKKPELHLLHRLGAEASLAYPWKGIRATFGWRLESFTKEFGATAPLKEREPWEEFEGEEASQGASSDPPADEEGAEEPRIERGLTNSVSLSVTQDDRNNPLFATRGGVRTARIERAGLLGLGTEDFTKLSATLIQFFPTLEDQTLAVRFVGGLGVGLPSQEQFYLGGANSLRGMSSIRTPSMAFVNVEYRVQIAPALVHAALFLDMGTNASWELFKSIGIEGRVNVPYLGWMRLALAWPITDEWTLGPYKVEVGFGPFF